MRIFEEYVKAMKQARTCISLLPQKLEYNPTPDDVHKRVVTLDVGKYRSVYDGKDSAKLRHLTQSIESIERISVKDLETAIVNMIISNGATPDTLEPYISSPDNDFYMKNQYLNQDVFYSGCYHVFFSSDVCCMPEEVFGLAVVLYHLMRKYARIVEGILNNTNQYKQIIKDSVSNAITMPNDLVQLHFAGNETTANEFIQKIKDANTTKEKRDIFKRYTKGRCIATTGIVRFLWENKLVTTTRTGKPITNDNINTRTDKPITDDNIKSVAAYFRR